MARAKKRTPQVEEVRPYVEGVAKNLIDKLYGPDGPAWGTRLTDIGNAGNEPAAGRGHGADVSAESAGQDAL